MATGLAFLGGAGIQTSALAFGGYRPPIYVAQSTSQSWNGTAWTGTPSLNSARGYVSGAGSSNTAALAIGGPTNPVVESYNGTSWTNITTLNTKRDDAGATGTQTLALVFGGNVPPSTSATELWNGTSWTSNPNGLSTARQGLGAAGTQTSALAFGGYTTTGLANTEEWTGPGAPTTKTITTS
jgi:hypothetical protein